MSQHNFPSAPRVENITSPAHSLVKEIRRAAGRGSLTTEGLCIAESFHLLEEALRSGREVPAVLVVLSSLLLVRPDLQPPWGRRRLTWFS